MTGGLTQRGILRLLPLLGIVSVCAGLAFTFPDIWLNVTFAAIVACAGFQLSYYNQLNMSLQDTLLAGMGLTLAEDSSALGDFVLAQECRTKIDRVYLPAPATHQFKLIRFTLTKGSGKHKTVCQYIGCEFVTEQAHHAVQLYDRKNVFRPFFAKDRQLESTEFNALFNVYSQDPRGPFYFFDPDTMSDLIDLKNSAGLQINMESVGNRVFVYTKATEVTYLVKSGLSWREILNGEIGADKRALYQQSVEQFIHTMQTIFDALDYKLKQTEKQ